MDTFKTKQEAFITGIRHFAPIVPGVIPFGLVYGVAATAIGITPLQGILMSVFVVFWLSQWLMGI